MRETLEEHVLDRMKALPDVLTLLGDGINSYFPRPKVSPDGQAMTPFIVSKFSGEAGNLVIATSWTMYVYDEHIRRYRYIRRIIKELRRGFHEWKVPPSEPYFPQFQRARAEYVSGQLTDGGWDKNMMFCRFSLVGL
jgi:hypothetical protein